MVPQFSMHEQNCHSVCVCVCGCGKDKAEPDELSECRVLRDRVLTVGLRSVQRQVVLPVLAL